MRIQDAAIKERGLICTVESVRAILDGRKTQTRRVIKPQFSKTWGYGVRNQDPEYFSVHVNIKEPDGNWRWLRCPYGKPGDRLYVRETWCPVDDTKLDEHGEKWIDYKATPRYAESHPAGWDNAPDSPDALKWISPLFMPRWASRITLEVTEVRVQRLFDISDEDAIAEGVSIERTRTLTPRGAFAITWDEINKKRGYGWEGGQNWYVWAITFRRVQP